MIGLDTNVLVRYFAQDDPAQTAKAIELIDRTLTRENPGFVSLVTVAELAWVLTNTYALSPTALADTIEYLLALRSMLVQNEQQVFAAAIALRSGTGSFPDALVGALGEWTGCTVTFTFDRRAARMRSFQLL